MRLFDISDVLSLTTSRLVSSRHMDGIYEGLNFLTGDNLFTHQIPRAMREVEPWLRTQYPNLFPDAPRMKELLADLDQRIAVVASNEERLQLKTAIAEWVEEVRLSFELPRQLPLHAMDRDMYTHINPLEELKAMVGDERVVVIGEAE